MDKTFDDLFNEFLKRNKETMGGDPMSAFKNEAKKLIDMIKNFESVDDVGDELDKKMDFTLGKPDSVETYSDGIFFFEKRIWHTPNGDIIKVIASDNPNKIKTQETEKSLEEQLKYAISEENYEKAAEIRDKIKMLESKPNESSKQKTKKSRKKSD